MKFIVIDKIEFVKIICKIIYVEILLWINIILVNYYIGKFD